MTPPWTCSCNVVNSDLRMRCRGCNSLRPIPIGVFFNREANNFYDVSAQGMGEDFYIFWRHRDDEFPSATPDVAADGFNAYGSGPVPITPREQTDEEIGIEAQNIFEAMNQMFIGRSTSAIVTALAMMIGHIEAHAERPELDRLLKLVGDGARVAFSRARENHGGSVN